MGLILFDKSGETISVLRFTLARFGLCQFAALTLLIWTAAPRSLPAQQSEMAHSEVSELPSAPEPQQTLTAEAGSQEPATSGSIVGTVLDPNGAVVQAAHVQLKRADGTELGSIETGGDGQYAFHGLAPASYRLTISGPGMGSVSLPELKLKAGEFHIVPNATLAVSAATSSITVTADREQISQEQVQIAVQQRVFKVVPNFYSSFDWNAPPMLAKQKYVLGLRAAVDPVGFIVVGAIAGAEQYRNIFPGFGGGIEGYGKRYGATYANHVSAEFLSRALLPAIFHADPRYFVMGTGSKKTRAWHAVSSTFITRGDDGSRKINFSTILGELGSGALSNLYFPENERGARLVYINGFSDIAANAFDNLIREFVLNRFTSRAKDKQKSIAP